MKKNGKKKSMSCKSKFSPENVKKIGDLIYGLFEFAVLTAAVISDIVEDEKENLRAKKSEDCKKKSVPTEDRIAIPKRVIAECKKAVGNKDNATAAVFTEKEAREIRRLRKIGLPIKAIAKQIHRRDRAVSAFLSAR